MKVPEKLKKKQRECSRCFGYGFHDLVNDFVKEENIADIQPFPISPESIIRGWKTIPCPVCGANCNPTKKECPKENKKKNWLK